MEDTTSRTPLKRIGFDAFPADDRGLLFGDSLFETMVCRNGGILLDRLHHERLQLGANRLGFTIDCDQVMSHARSYASSLEGDFVLRLTVTRGSGPRGYAAPTTAAPRVHVRELPLANMAEVASAQHLALADVYLPEQPALAQIKHGNRLEQVLAATQASTAGVDAALMLSSSGSIQCLSNANLFVLIDGVLCTPDCSQCGVAGTRRRFILESVAGQLKKPCKIAAFSLDDLWNCQGAFSTNAVQGPREIASLDGRVLQRWNGFEELYRTYWSLIDA